MNNGNQLKNSHEHNFDSLQFFRFLAALMVVIVHSSFYTSERLTIGSPLFTEGSNGVNLFFVISGFVMIISSEKLVSSPSGWKIFAIKRIIRIVPIYWIITTLKIVILLLSPSAVYHTSLDIWFVVKSYFFIPAVNIEGEFRPFYGVGWTLNFEMFFYLLFTIALGFKIRPLPFLSAIFIPLAILSFYRKSDWPSISFYADIIVLNFLYGMIAAKLILRGVKLPKVFAQLSILLGIICLFFPGLVPNPAVDNRGAIIIGVASFLVIYGGASIEYLLTSKIPKFLLFLGGASYSLYLIHPTVAPIVPTVLNKLNFKYTLVSISLCVIVAIAASIIFFKYCEKPLTQFLTRVCKKLNFI